uniref:Clathrin light chain n=1 Tax=Helicotheca tamesis TaxID=374047 RepID=A0A7S2GYA0_9STRA|mmetsp:Transcript_13331/g.18342  ORF Transcript_13331/g.18342 Transcript_13331/m.18342 type:complete len:216 (+) Transcript_13331:199-846(+)|eukprot:CAMPEP_0185724426 /NCGR_PEP_ID=MMETSP1171-20130828/912_1 /TAXON_ID=374046 /ORGANISM="Helicotheca tamensis, Strain CCMP826" /LENGTH=215 /DNA_ID=CAMNT_0028392277 /DNA_START=127 /DNA_END=774 /DNA_ORIENTATION=+
MADEQTGEFFNPPGETQAEIGDEPIIMMPPAPEEGAEFIGDVDAAAPTGDEPVILMGAPEETGDMGFAGVPEGETGAVLLEDVGDEDPDEEVEAEPELSPMAKWNNEWQVTLMQRKDEENAAKAKDVEQARVDLEKFQAEREARREAKMARNRSEEQDKLEALEADLENDNSWQRVVKLVELTQDSAEASEDTKRMKDVFILLKNEPSRAAMLTA